MNFDTLNAQAGARDEYITGRAAAWFAFAMTIGLMLFDYIDRQVIVSLFPYLKAEWALSDKQLGLLVSVVSITVALGALPVALLADRVSRVKSIVAMAAVWSLATISCMFARGYGMLFAARAMVGLGEAGYGSAGAALIASVFPVRLRSLMLSAFFAAASVGSVLGVLLGGVITARWGWKAAFGVVGVPGLLLALLYLLVRDYRTVELVPRLERATQSPGNALRHIIGVLTRTRTLLWVCLGAAVQLIVVSAVGSWLPSYLNRVHGIAPDQAAIKAALVVLCGAAGTVVWGAVVDRCGAVRARLKLHAVTVLCFATTLVLLPTFGAHVAGFALAPQTQFALIALGGFFMTCSVGPASAVVIDVAHPGVRATGAAVLSVFQNLFGLAIGPFLAGALSDAFGLESALTVIASFGLASGLLFAVAARSYEGDMQRFGEVRVEAGEAAAEGLR